MPPSLPVFYQGSKRRPPILSYSFIITHADGFFNTRNGNLLRGTILGHGDVPVAACIQLLREVGYNGTFSLEFEGAEENLPALRLGLSYMRKLAEMPIERP